MIQILKRLLVRKQNYSELQFYQDYKIIQREKLKGNKVIFIEVLRFTS